MMYLIIFKKQPWEKLNGYSLAENEDILKEIKKNAPVKRVIELEDRIYSKDELESLVKKYGNKKQNRQIS